MKRKDCWVTGIPEIVCKTGSYFVWLQQSVGDVKSILYVFNPRLLDMFTQKWTANVSLFQKIIWSLKSIYQILIFCFRVTLTQLIPGALSINNDMHRYSDCNTNRNCVFCPDIVGNEDHFLLVCPLYTDLRNRFLEQNGAQSLQDMLQLKDTKRCLLLSKFTFHAMNRRKQNIICIDV